MGYSDSDYDCLRQLAFSRSATLVGRSRNALLETRLKPTAVSAGAANLTDILSSVQTDEPMHLHRAASEAMTVNDTAFFRDRKMFDVLQNTIVPRLIEANSAQRILSIWSAAGSTGQEAYSLAMLLSEHFAELEDWDVTIIGTDISPYAIERARRGWYSRLEVNRGLPAPLLVKYLVRRGEQWEITPKLRSACAFQHADLCVPLPSLPPFDLVLLCNVLLYFSPESRASALRGVHGQMASGGYLVLGASEQAEDSTNLFQMESAQECCFYRPVARTQI